MSEVLPAPEIEEALRSVELAGWRFADDALHAQYETGGFAAGLAFVNLVGDAAEAMDHHPDIDLRYGFVVVRSSSHDSGGVTRRDLRLARRIAAIAADLGLTPADG